MVDVPRGSPKGTKAFARIEKVITDMISNVDTLFIKLASGAGMEIENDAGATVMEIAEASGKVSIGTLEISTSVAIPFGHHTGVALADLTATFGAPNTLPDGWAAIYENDTDGKTYLIMVYLDVFWSEELTSITA